MLNYASHHCGSSSGMKDYLIFVIGAGV